MNQVCNVLASWFLNRIVPVLTDHHFLVISQSIRHFVKTDIPENCHNAIAIVPPLAQYYRNIHVAYCNS